MGRKLMLADWEEHSLPATASVIAATGIAARCASAAVARGRRRLRRCSAERARSAAAHCNSGRSAAAARCSWARSDGARYSWGAREPRAARSLTIPGVPNRRWACRSAAPGRSGWPRNSCRGRCGRLTLRRGAVTAADGLPKRCHPPRLSLRGADGWLTCGLAPDGHCVGLRRAARAIAIRRADFPALQPCWPDGEPKRRQPRHHYCFAVTLSAIVLRRGLLHILPAAGLRARRLGRRG